MGASELTGSWRSIRRYKDQPVSDEVVTKILEAGRRAPSWENVQPWHFIVVRDQGLREKLTKLSLGQKHVLKAPLLILCCGDLNAWSKENTRAALKELMEAGALKGNDDTIENVFLANPVFNVSLLGPNIVLARTFEQLSLAVGFMVIEAMNNGLGCCIMGALGNEVTKGLPEVYDEVRKDLGLPDGVALLTYLTIGYPDEDPKLRPRKPLDKIVSLEKYGEPFVK